MELLRVEDVPALLKQGGPRSREPPRSQVAVERSPFPHLSLGCHLQCGLSRVPMAQALPCSPGGVRGAPDRPGSRSAFPEAARRLRFRLSGPEELRLRRLYATGGASARAPCALRPRGRSCRSSLAMAEPPAVVLHCGVRDGGNLSGSSHSIRGGSIHCRGADLRRPGIAGRIAREITCLLLFSIKLAKLS